MKKIIVIFLLIVEVIILNFTYKSFSYRNELDEVNMLGNSSSMFAMFKNEGDGNYLPYNSLDNTFPSSDDYMLNDIRSGCIDASGNSVDTIIEFENDEIEIKTNQSVYCYLYFDIIRNLYNVIRKEAKIGTYATRYTGNYNYDDHETIYYYTANNTTQVDQIKNKWNVVFGGFCWQMFRTTENGGVKLLYNGMPIVGFDSETGKNTYDCRDNREYIAIPGSRTTTSLNTSATTSSNYWYGTSYFANPYGFILDGETSQERWSQENSDNIIGKYTCRSSNRGNNCTTLYYVDDYYNASNAYVIPYSNRIYYSSIGDSNFNSSEKTLSSVGYMYNPSAVYDYNTRTFSTTPSYSYTNYLALVNVNNYDFSESVNLTNLKKGNQIKDESGLDDYSALVGMYIKYSNYPYYVYAMDSDYIYFIAASGKTLEQLQNTLNEEIKYGSEIEYNETTGALTITGNIVTITKGEHYLRANEILNKYTCNSTSLSCADPRVIYMISGANSHFYYFSLQAYYYQYGYSFEERSAAEQADGKGRYKLVGKETNGETEAGTLQRLTNPISIISNDSINKSHYTCFNASGICDTLYYVYYVSNFAPDQKWFYITLNNGKTIEKAIYDMLHDDNVNVINSNAKNVIENWYGSNLTKFTPYLDGKEIYCNNREISSFGNFNPYGGSITGGPSSASSQDSGSFLTFAEAIVTNDLSCPTKRDSFTYEENAKGNGKLQYPVGMISAPEIKNKQMLTSETSMFTITPRRFASYFSGNTYGSSIYAPQSGAHNLYAGNYIVKVNRSLIPVIALTSDSLEYTQGDGRMTNPYVLDYGMYNITNENLVYNIPTKAFSGNKIIITNNQHYQITSFKLNGELITGNTFIMPEDDVIITDITRSESYVIESDHPFYATNGETIYYEKTFNEATSITVDVFTYFGNGHRLYIYDSINSKFKTYQHGSGLNETLNLTSNYVKITASLSNNSESNYGFKVIITPNYS